MKLWDIAGLMDSGAYRTELSELLVKVPFTREEIDVYLRMLVFAIDFRSHHTVTHTITTESASVEIATLLGALPDEIMLVRYGALLHDLGKKMCIRDRDMKQQVIPLMLEWKDILSGRAGFFYNLNNAGGMSFFGVFFFFLSSPFTFLTVFIDKSYLYEFINLLILLKLALSAGTVSCFFRYAEPKLNHMPVSYTHLVGRLR